MVHSRESILLGPFPNASLKKIPNSVCWPKIIELALQPHTWIFNTALYWISASQKFGFLARAALLTVGSQKLRDPCPALQHSLFAHLENKWLNSKQKEFFFASGGVNQKAMRASALSGVLPLELDAGRSEGRSQ